ncbi:MAG: M20/M25/M40 family metallo-hydrolase [Bacteroidales bacterium]
MKNKAVILLVCLQLHAVGFGQKEGLSSINKDDLKAHMEFLASDLTEGRETGTKANDLVALYLKTSIMRLGLKPGSADYFQHIPLVYHRNSMEKSFLKISDAGGNETWSTDSILFLTTGNRTLSAEGRIVFAGYGYKNETSGYNDLEGVDLKDKIVLFMSRTPEMIMNGEGAASLSFQSEESKIGNLFGSGAKALLMVFDPSHSIQDPYQSVLAQLMQGAQIAKRNSSSQSPPFIIAIIKPSTADKLLKTGGKSLSQLQEEITETGKPVSFEVPDISVSLNAAVESHEFDGKNVIGIIEGSDPVLKNEYIVYSAHYDHAGKADNGDVFNGADDNASGSIGLLETAKAFMSLKKKPLRSIVFLWADGEEKGLIGSDHYVKNPLFPLENTILDINLDMIGRSRTPADTGSFFGMDLNVTDRGEVMLYTRHESTDLMKIISGSAENTGIKVIDMGEDIEAGGSDHESFWAMGIPAIMFHTGIHADLHQKTDDENRIDYDKMEQVIKLVFRIGYQVANQRERLRIDNPVTE